MLHEVIMPALGMAQDTGVIVAWLKSPGDKIAEGDALFEVETDKATMEVEAQAAGWLADVRAPAGAEVPVGDVIAVIADASGEADAPPAAPGAAQSDAVVAQPDASETADLPHDLPHDLPLGERVIMPALGMAQDTGAIVAWLKAPGDAVAEDDVLLEVETDKSTMEVPAGASGYVAALLADAGQEVPVGDVIAVISAEKPAHPTKTRAAAKPAPTPAPDEARATAEARAKAPPASPSTSAAEPARQRATAGRATPETGRIFASPKARRLAAEAGLDLARLVAAGYPQPYHVADIAILRNLPADPAPAAPAATPAILRQVAARAAAAPGRELLDWLHRAEGRSLPVAALWIRFAAAALRQARQAQGDLVIELVPVGAAATRTRNPDRIGLAADPEAADPGTGDPETGEERAPDLILRDVSTSAITGLSLAAAEAPTLSILGQDDALVITLDFDAAQLEDSAAITLVAGFAERLNDPLTQLL